MTESPWLTVVEAARLASVSERTIRRGVANGSLRSIRPGGPRGNIRVLRESLLDLAGQTRPV